MADFPPKGLQTQSAPEGGRKTMTMVMVMMMIMMMMMMMTIMMMMIAMCFLHPKGPETGRPMNNDDYDEIGDNDNTDDDYDDDDDNDDNDGTDVFFFKNIFL